MIRRRGPGGATRRGTGGVNPGGLGGRGTVVFSFHVVASIGISSGYDSPIPSEESSVVICGYTARTCVGHRVPPGMHSKSNVSGSKPHVSREGLTL